VIYLDNSATTPISDAVRAAMEPFLANEFGNASSVYTLGNRARVALEEARETVARYIGAHPREITFTSSGTEANNTALKGRFFHLIEKGIAANDIEIITDRAEHHAVLYPVEFLEKLGANAAFAAIDNTGHVDIDSLSTLLNDRTRIVSIMQVNNEVGAINDIAAIGRLVKATAPQAALHTDAVQALGKIPVDVGKLHVDMLTLSAHKIHGPKGIGALYTRSGIEWEPLMHGGAQERNRRGGTESVALAVGFAAAIKELAPDLSEYVLGLRAYLLDQLRTLPKVELNSASDDTCSPATVNFSFHDDVLRRLDSDALLIRFDLAGIAISNGSACTSGSLQPSHVLLAMGKSKEVASKSIRVSFSRYNTIEEIDRFVEVLKTIIA
jgi:cysteine desulfurase